MEREALRVLLGQGENLERIEPPTEQPLRQRVKNASRSGLDRERLAALVEAGASVTAISETLRRSPSTIRRWLIKSDLETVSTTRRREGAAARSSGQAAVDLVCRHHGVTRFGLEGRGVYRCLRCRQERVARRRRAVKAALVAEAGGSCLVCGYDRCLGALHFHHRDPAEKSFALGVDGIARSINRCRAEVRKCVLLCSNCYAEVEAGLVTIPA